MADPLAQLPIEAHSAQMRSAMEALFTAARTEAPIVLRAQLGCEVPELARFAHFCSGRCGGPFLTLPCSALTDLPVRDLSAAAQGTVFLHDIGDLVQPLQSKLVHLLDALATRGLPPRLICSTERDLDTEVTEGRLQPTLCFRLNVVDILIPPLSERRADILPAAQALLSSLSADLGRRPPSLSPGAAAWLQQHPFPGNLRELRNLLERALLTSRGGTLDSEALAALDDGGPRVGEDVTLRDLETEHVSRVISRVGSFSKAAVILGVAQSTLWRRRKRQEHDDADASKRR